MLVTVTNLEAIMFTVNNRFGQVIIKKIPLRFIKNNKWSSVIATILCLLPVGLSFGQGVSQSSHQLSQALIMMNQHRDPRQQTQTLSIRKNTILYGGQDITRNFAVRNDDKNKQIIRHG